MYVGTLGVSTLRKDSNDDRMSYEVIAMSHWASSLCGTGEYRLRVGYGYVGCL